MQGNKAYWLKIDSYNQAGEAIAFPLTWRVKASTEINDQADATSQVFATRLSQGWNHGKLPLDKTLTNPEDIERFIAGTAIERIWFYQQSQDRWYSWAKGAGSNVSANQSLTELNPDAIYWVYSSREHIVAKASGINSQKYYLHNNHLGSVSFESDTSGAITESSLYQPYGASLANNTQSSKKVSPYSFSGKEQDGSGLYYFEARYYDPVTTRFISPDSLFAVEMEKCIEAVGECNLYQYTANNPITRVDLEGTDVTIVVGGPYAKASYGHVAVRVHGEGYDMTYDMGRYGDTWGVGEGEAQLRVWTDFDAYIKGENATGRTSDAYTYSTTSSEDQKIMGYYSSLTDGTTPNKERATMQQFRLSKDYHAANNNCTTSVLDGVKAGKASLINSIADEKYHEGNGLGFMERSLFNAAKDTTGVTLPLDLKVGMQSEGGYAAHTIFNSENPAGKAE